MFGNHLIGAWSRVQPRIALSSGKAEPYAGLSGNHRASLGFVHMMREFHSQDLGSYHSSPGMRVRVRAIMSDT